jgi:hypothetical protein
MDEFLSSLADRIKHNATSLDIFRRLYTPPAEVPPSAKDSPLQTKVCKGYSGCLWVRQQQPTVALPGSVGLGSPQVDKVSKLLCPAGRLLC